MLVIDQKGHGPSLTWSAQVGRGACPADDRLVGLFLATFWTAAAATSSPPPLTVSIPAAHRSWPTIIVDDLDALLERLRQEGVKIDAKRMNESYGAHSQRFSDPLAKC